MASINKQGLTASSDRSVTPNRKLNENNELVAKTGALPPTHSSLHAVRHAVAHGVEMGVLDSGVPYLSGLGLAKMCGIDHTTLQEMASNWSEERLKPRGRQIEVLLKRSGYTEPSLFVRIEHRGIEINAYTEPVCIALLEYYAFVVKEPRLEAQENFRTLARVKFREYVYEAVGYSPQQVIVDSWKHFHDRMDLTKDAVPFGYFGIYHEIAPMIVPMISAGVEISPSLIPDISVGIAWSAHWKANKLADKYGECVRYEHNFPDYYPQSKSNPQSPLAYPDQALGEFKRWLRQHYIATKLPTYLTGKVKENAITFAAAAKATLALSSNSKVTGAGSRLGR